MVESDAATGGSAGSTTETSTTAPARPGSSAWDSAARLAVGGLQFGLIIGLCAVGLSLIYATTGLVNFAISEMITLGAVLTWWLNVSLGIQLIAAIPLSMALGGLVGATMDIGLWRPLRRRGTGLVAMMIISIGLAIVMRYSILYVFGDRRKPYGDYAVQTKVLFTVGPVSLIPKDVIIMVVSAALLIGVGLLLRFTKLGKAMRAIADNPDLASSTGIDVNRVIPIVWFLGGALAALGATFLALSEQVQWLLGNQLLLLMFAAMTLGGLGTAYGALVGSFVIGCSSRSRRCGCHPASTTRYPGRAEERRRTRRADPRPALSGRRASSGAGSGSAAVDWGTSSRTRLRAGSARRPPSTRSRPSASTCTSATPACSTSARSASWPWVPTAWPSPC